MSYANINGVTVGRYNDAAAITINLESAGYVTKQLSLADAEAIGRELVGDDGRIAQLERELLSARAERELARMERARLTPETCDKLAEQCRSGYGEASRSRAYALARQALQSAADWLRRAEQGE